RALRAHREAGAGAATEESAEAARALRRSARRLSAGLHTFRPLLDRDWAQALSPELAWVSGTLAVEHGCTARLERLLLALHRLSGAPVFPGQAGTAPGARTAPAVAAPAALPGGSPAPPGPPPARPAAGAPARPPTAPPAPTRPARPARPAGSDRGRLTAGAASAGARLDRQLPPARTRAHSPALQALRSSRFHAVADQVAVLASEVPLAPGAAHADLRP